MQGLFLSSIPNDIYFNKEVLLSLLSPERRNYVLSKKNDGDFYACCFSELLLKRALGDGAPKELVYGFYANNKPFLKNCDIHFNISHTHGFVCVSVDSESETGLDIQAHTHYNEKIPQRFFHEIELEALKSCPTERRHKLFFDLWAIKESFVKCTGGGISSGFSDFFAQEIGNETFRIINNRNKSDDLNSDFNGKEYISRLYNINESFSLALTNSTATFPDIVSIFDYKTLMCN